MINGMFSVFMSIYGKC